VRVPPLGRPTVKAGPSYGEWHYPPELPSGWVVARRVPEGWKVRFKDGTAPVREETITAADFGDRSQTLRVAAALALTKRTPMLTNPDKEDRINYVKAAKKGYERVGILSKIFSKVGAKTAVTAGAKVGAKVGVKTGAKAVPIAGQVLMVIDAAPEAYRVTKEGFALNRQGMREIKEARGVKGRAAAIGRHARATAKQQVTGAVRVGAAALVGSDVVHSIRKRNPSAYRDEIAQLLQNMPSDWRSQYNSGRRKLAAVGGPALPATPTPEQAMELIGITAGGNPSGDAPVGPNTVPQAVRDEAMHGIRLSHKRNYGAWDFIGLARAIQLALAPGVSNKTRSRMRNYFSRHRKDAQSAKWGNEANPSRGWMAWLNWGGDAGQDWVTKSSSNPLTKVNPMRNFFIDNPYYREHTDQYGKICFYIYNDDGTPVLTGAGTPQWCYNKDKAELMIRKAERAGYRVSPSAVSPGPRVAPTPGPFGGGAAPTPGPFAPSAAPPPPRAAPSAPPSSGGSANVRAAVTEIERKFGRLKPILDQHLVYSHDRIHYGRPVSGSAPTVAGIDPRKKFAVIFSLGRTGRQHPEFVVNMETMEISRADENGRPRDMWNFGTIDEVIARGRTLRPRENPNYYM